MTNLLKRFGRTFFIIKEKNQSQICQSVLLIEGRFILPNNFALIIRNVKERFKNAHLTVLTFQDKKEFIKDNFPDVEIIVPGDKIKSKKYQLAIQLFSLLRRNFNFIILSSLDISVVSISLIFARCLIFLHNRWLEWYRLRQRTVLDILRGTKSVDKNRRVINKGIKDVIKSLGRIFVILSEARDEDIKSRILIEDNGYTEVGHVITAVQRTKEVFINPDITILTFAERKQHFTNMFPETRLVIAEGCNKYRLAIQLYRMRKHRFNCIVLTTLDVSPIVVSFLFFRAEVLLYNRWHQWWSLELRNVKGYLKGILKAILNIPTVIYLLIVSGFILLRTFVRAQFMNLRMTHPKE